ncbi:MAG: hypothetical protein A2481_03150 [Candidatus Yonathbacteria bacterium RIFOXYC2_FULL_47_9]|nr:MAG: hypothetical protein A2481_03150 [Candidatus Yonathbacteria bacterium RIFOXYC2_FULL_47_9]HAT68367.1 hypothetical protein [Candidatus Yonathbacteria bacterium]
MEFMQVLGFDRLFGQTGVLLEQVFQWFPYWAPIIFGAIFWHEWMSYVQERFRSAQKWIVLEIKLPKEIHKTPVAMEVVLNALYQSSEGTWFDKTWKGKVKDWFSLEMVSIEGDIKFFIRTTGIYKNVIEAQIYGQYPDIEIHEVPDYTRYVDYRGREGDWEMVGIEYELSKKDPYPIKTYVDYGLDKEGVKEEFKTDPLTSVIEYLGSIGPGEQVWIQILVQAASKRYTKKDGTKGDWKDEGKAIIDDLTKRNEKTPEGMPVFKMMMATKGESEVIAAIERSMGKFGFDCGIRALYLVKRDKFNPSNIKALGGLLRPFTTNNLNGFKPMHFTAGFDYPWQDYNGIRLSHHRKEQFKAYKQRSWFYSPRKLKPFVLTSEELATIYHFPGGVLQTPTFGRIPSRKNEAPVNLPI